MGKDSQDQNQDLIGLKEAARISGKSQKTIRNWVHKGTLKDMRLPGDNMAPIVISLKDLRAYLATLSPPPSYPPAKGEQPEVTQGPPTSSQGQTAPDQDIETHPLVKALREQIVTLQAMVSTVHAMADNMERERDRLLEEQRQLKAEVKDLRTAKEALERELAGRVGIRGLLRAFWR